jgi:5-methylcytosine-specific restriction enzyme A
MPDAADRWCPRCRSPHPAGSECPVGKAERLARVDAQRPGARQRGYTGQWERRRATFLKKHRWCVICGEPAEQVDHIVPVAVGGSMWDEANWQPLCRHHHSAKTMGEMNERRVPRHA